MYKRRLKFITGKFEINQRKRLRILRRKIRRDSHRRIRQAIAGSNFSGQVNLQNTSSPSITADLNYCSANVLSDTEDESITENDVPQETLNEELSSDSVYDGQPEHGCVSLPVLPEQTKVQKLASWAVSTNQTRKSVKILLEILREDEPHLPKDRRTLCATPKATTSIIENMGSGQYLHIGIAKCLNIFFIAHEHIAHKIKKQIFIDINIDGVPLGKNTAGVLWPILMNVVGYNYVLMVGVYFGHSKPENINEYLKKFVSEFLELRSSGLFISSTKKKYGINIRSIVADAPARAFLLNIHTYSGYNSCNKCKIIGRYVLHRITFPYEESATRTDEEYRAKLFPNHHLNENPVEIEKLPIDCVCSIPIDYMHAVLLGVTMQLMTQWISVRRRTYSLERGRIAELSQYILSISLKLPHEFSRTPRPLHYLRRYKATELRQLILYTLPVLCQGLLRSDVYNHLLKFHCAVRILCSKDLCLSSHHQFAASLLQSFVFDFDTIYDSHQMSFNVHSLLHLCEDVEYFSAPMDDYSSFKFENFLQFLKKLSKNCTRPLQQIYNRYAEKIHHNNLVNFERKVQQNKRGHDGSYNYVFANNCKFSVYPPNNFCLNLSEGCIFKIKKIVAENDTFLLYGNRIVNTEPIYSEPLDSRELGMYKTNQLNFGAQESFNLNCNIKKVAAFDFNNEYYMLALIH